MRKPSICLLVSGTLLFAAAAVSSAQAAKKPAELQKPDMHAVAQGAPAAPKTSHELGKMKWMTGTWQCTGKTMASAMGPEHPTEARVEVATGLEGFWMISRYREKRTAQNTVPISADEYWTYDAAANNWQRMAMDTTGGWAVGTSPGWDRGKIVWTSEGPMGGQKMKFRNTFTQKSDREIAYVGEMGSSDGKFSTVWNITCKK